jgi:hypothetical protein|tara:strand:- start:399 stop:851 length:453 start_codon:yes stop_codon:yes gene_type:complete
MNEKTDNSDKIPEFFLEREKKMESNEKLDRTDNNSEKMKPDGKTTGFDIRFKVTIIVIAIIGFSASAYIFSSEPFGELTENVGASILDKSQFIDQIDQCLQNQTVGDVTLNSFTQKWAFDFKEKISKAETNQELESIMNEFYTIVSHCKP